jgi:sulfate/thiosulfate-binding protein
MNATWARAGRLRSRREAVTGPPPWTRRAGLALIAAGLLAVPATAGCGGSSSASDSGGGGGANLTLVAYSTPEEAYKELIPAFNGTSRGKGVEFDQSYASSGEQSRAVEGGLPADVVEFSLEPDITRLVDAGLVDASWNRNEYDGFVTDSVVVFMVRKGNPKNIETWDDLIKDGVEVLEPNPFTSGGAKWNIMAAYGAQLERGRSPAQARDYLAQLFEHVPVLDKSARESLQTFASGKGDVLLGYENEAILARQQGEELDYVVPDETILIENPIAIVNETNEPETAQAFVDFLYTEKAQRIFAGKGYRPVVEGLLDKTFPTPAKLFEIDEFGGWDRVNDEFFDPEKGAIAEIFQSQGKSTASD